MANGTFTHCLKCGGPQSAVEYYKGTRVCPHCGSPLSLTGATAEVVVVPTEGLVTPRSDSGRVGWFYRRFMAVVGAAVFTYLVAELATRGVFLTTGWFLVIGLFSLLAHFVASFNIIRGVAAASVILAVWGYFIEGLLNTDLLFLMAGGFSVLGLVFIMIAMLIWYQDKPETSLGRD